ncbi:hypothetical protein CRM22_008663 [Opisthorchis felineus]|uniref:C-type lectin domain-containing protein n=1 Tax=Opisthorchis felineus TaxID=147828 RepID=A0A4S2LI56_OPIFE|nr:hypothetical protein CRM22_008663 [Opisthorchis felineus]
MLAPFCVYLLATLLLVPWGDAQDQEYCSFNFCFTVNKLNKSVVDAETSCNHTGRSLLTISNKAEQIFISNTLARVVGPSVKLWFGLYSAFDHYRWFSGYQAVANTYFSSPPSHGSGICFTVHAAADLYTWTPERCDTKLWFLCGSYPQTKTSPTDVSKRSSGCPPPYHLVNGACFLPKSSPEDRLSRFEAAHECRQLANGTLATISSLVEQDFLSLILAASSTPMWIGLQLVGGEHRWDNQANVTLTNWIKRQPAGGEQIRCTMAHHGHKHLGEWEDVDCDTKLGYLCQARPTASSFQAISGFSPDQGRCRTGFAEFNSRCYRIDSRVTSQTESAPNMLGQDLCPSRLTPRSSGEMALLRFLANTQPGLAEGPIWIGVNFTYNAADAPKFQFLAEDRLPVTISSMLDFAKIPSAAASQSGLSRSTVAPLCVALTPNSTDLVWMSCSTPLPSVCGYPLSDFTFRATAMDTACPTGWSSFGHTCYSPVNDTVDTWAGAEAACQSLHSESHVVSLRSPNEQQVVSELLRGARGWLGLRVQVWTGSNRILRFQWSDGSPINFLFNLEKLLSGWRAGEIEQCFVLHGSTRDWDRVSCSDRHAFMCQLTLSDQSPLASTFGPSKPTGSPNVMCSDAGLVPQLCIELQNTRRVFWDAVDGCQSTGRTLLTIPSKEHQQFVMDSLQKLTGGRPVKAFVGLFSSAGRWRWVSGYKSLPSTFWSPNHPQQEYHCVYVDTDTKGLDTWKSGPCDAHLPFICGTPLPDPESTGTNLPVTTCPQNFLRIGASCFSVNARLSDRETWHTASERCKAAGGNLATVSSLHEQDGLTALLGLQSLSAWIGLHLLDGVHSWVQGSPVVFTNWGKGQPAGRGTRCTFVDRHFTSLGEWGDEECDVPMGYICQADPIPDKGTSLIPKLDGLFVRGRCADGYYEYRKQCFGIHSMLQGRSAADLRDLVTGQCRRMVHVTGSDCSTHWGTVTCPVVGTPHTHADAAFLRVLLSQFGGYAKSAWIGLKLRRSNGSLQTSSEDESLLGASTLIAFEPDSLTGSDRWDSSDSRYHCVVASILDTQLKVVDCEEIKLPAICAYFLDDHALHSKNRVIDADKCPVGWSPFGGKCYAVMPSSDLKNWSAAEKTCNSLTTHFSSPLDATIDGHLASIHSLEEQHHLTELAPNTSLWLGLNIFYEPLYGHVPSNSSILTNRSVHLLWTDDSPVDYVSFSRDSSGFGIDQMHCFTIDGENSQWNPTECFQERNFICQLSSSDVSEDFSETQDPPISAANCDNTFPLNSKSSGDCYRIFQSTQTWASAERACSSLRAGAHLASFHNREELDELVDVVSRSGIQKANVWIGLYESDLAYHWSDETAVTYIPLSADQSKYGRHLSQDCFVLSPSLDVGTYTVRAVDCSSSQLVMVCKSPNKNPIRSRIDDPTQWKLMLCPPGYRQYADRCFSVLLDSTTWAEGDKKCIEQAKQFQGYSGSLARIDNSLVQEFVASLLDDLPPKISSAWIGLQQSLSNDTISAIWSDGLQCQFMRPIHREAIQEIVNSGQLSMCTALYRSTYPRLNGLWLQWSCEKPVFLASVCQASPPSVRTDDLRLTSSCPSGFYLGTTGLSPMSPRGRKISQPVCYRLLNTSKKLNWKESSEHCKALSTPGNNVSLLSVASVFEASFLRSWLRMPREMGGAGLPADEPVWSGLQVTNKCPDCYRNWTWDTPDNASVRFTDWLIPPTPTPSGCYIFHPNPYTRRESMANSGLGSLQPVGSCDLTYFAVCQTLANETVEQHRTNGPVTPAAHQAIRPNCFTFDAHGSDKLFLTNVTQSHTGRPCIRWDLVPNNLTDFRLDSSWLKHRLHMTEIVGADGFVSYAENYCSVLYLVQFREYKYECYVSLDPLTSEECNLTPCPHILRRFYLLGPVTTAIILLFLLGAVAILAVGFWRGYAPLRSGYRRYFSPTRFSSSRVHRSSVQFVPPDTVSCVQPVHVNDGTNGYAKVAHNTKSKAISEKPASSDHSRLLLNQPISRKNDTSGGPGYIYTPPVGPADPAQTGFTNPIYAPRSFIVPEDDYDPEADI